MSLGNTFGKTSKSYNSGKNVFHAVHGVYSVGGKIDVSGSGYAVGDVIPAGTPVVYNLVTKVITPVSTVTDSNKATVNGLLRHDVVVDELAKSTNGAATGSVVYAAEVYVNRLAVDISLCLPTLPQIIAIKEA